MSQPKLNAQRVVLGLRRRVAGFEVEVASYLADIFERFGADGRCVPGRFSSSADTPRYSAKIWNASRCSATSSFHTCSRARQCGQ